MRVEGKVLVVTGASSGIGRQVALQLTQRGARVLGVDRNAAPADIPSVQLDVSDATAMAALPQRAIDMFGHVDGYIHCAGIVHDFKPIASLDFATIDHIFAVNWQSTVYLAKAFIPVLTQRPEACIVNVSSMGGFLPVPGQSIYGASKAAVKLFTEGLHAELSATPVHVMVVIPGAVNTNILGNSGLAAPTGAEKTQQYILQADKAARQIIDGVERNAYRVLLGVDAKMFDLLCRLAPKSAARLMNLVMNKWVLK